MAVEDTMKHQIAIEAALESHSKGELVRMLSNIMKTYVIDGTTPLKPDVGRIHVPSHLRELDFPSLIEALKFHLDLSDLDKFQVMDGQVYVTLGDREYALHGPAPTQRHPTSTTATAATQPNAPPAANPTPKAASPTPPRSRPNKGGGVFGGGSSAPQADIPMTPEPTEEKKKSPTEADDRFRMLELD